MRRLAAALLCIAVTAPARAAPNADAPDHARLAMTAFLDDIANKDLALRDHAIAALHTKADAERRQAWVRKTILELIGGLPKNPGPLNVRLFHTYAGDGFRVENIVYDSLPGYRVTANVFVPDGKGPFPAVIVSPGHVPSGKAWDYSFGANFARAGILALSYDIVGEGERLQHYDPQLGASKVGAPTSEHSLAAYQTMLLGEHVSRYFIEDAMRGVDYLASRKDVDARRIGAFGCSGGGTITAYLAALDPRIKAAAVACYVNDMRHLLASVGPQEAEQSIPDFTANGLDIPDWIELAAPKPLAIVSTTEDMFPIAGARAAHDEAKRFWGLFGAEDHLQWIVGPGHHGALAPISANILAFFTHYLENESQKPSFIAIEPARPEDILVTPTGQLSTSIGSETIQSLDKGQASALVASPAIPQTPAELAKFRTQIRRDIRSVTHASAQPGSPPPLTNITGVDSRDSYHLEHITFHPSGEVAFNGLFAVPAQPSQKRSVVLLDDRPLDVLSRPNGEIEKFVNAGWTVLALEPVGGSGEELKSPLLGEYNLLALRTLLVGRTIIGLRIDQTLQAVDWLSAQHDAGSVAVYGVGALGPVALHAAALDDRIRSIYLQDTQVSYLTSVENPISRGLPEIALPGILQKYDLPDLMIAVAPRPVFDINPTDQLGLPLRQAAFESTFSSVGTFDDKVTQSRHVRWLGQEPSDLPYVKK
ncbi:MAG: acetylxylan esterase [Alphaproteobacteria bacterium]|nr:acetylxylan esterase [Alphaproteobacteria bacterium]